jgi:hypothetical protein
VLRKFSKETKDEMIGRNPAFLFSKNGEEIDIAAEQMLNLHHK